MLINSTFQLQKEDYRSFSCFDDINHCFSRKKRSSLTSGCITSWVGMHTPWRQVPLRLQEVPSAQGKLPFLVEHCGVPSSWHHSWLQISLSEVLGQWTNSSPKICWHCWSRLYLVPGSSFGNSMALSGTSSRQSPMDTIQCNTASGWLYYGLWRLWTLRHCDNCKCVSPCVWHDNVGKIFRPSCVLTINMNNLDVTNAVQFYGQACALNLAFDSYSKSEFGHCSSFITLNNLFVWSCQWHQLFRIIILSHVSFCWRHFPTDNEHILLTKAVAFGSGEEQEEVHSMTQWKNKVHW